VDTVTTSKTMDVTSHPLDADFMCKIRWIRMRIRICRPIKIVSYYGYCNSTYLLKIKQLQMN